MPPRMVFCRSKLDNNGRLKSRAYSLVLNWVPCLLVVSDYARSFFFCRRVRSSSEELRRHEDEGATVAGRFLSVSTNMVEAGAGEGHAWLAV